MLGRNRYLPFMLLVVSGFQCSPCQSTILQLISGNYPKIWFQWCMAIDTCFSWCYRPQTKVGFQWYMRWWRFKCKHDCQKIVCTQLKFYKISCNCQKSRLKDTVKYSLAEDLYIIKSTYLLLFIHERTQF